MRQFLLHAHHILGPVNAEMGFGGMEHSDFKTVLQRSQLFERFRALQRRRFELRQSAQHSRLVTVQTDVMGRPGERSAREVESGSVESGHHFHHIARAELFLCLNRACESRHLGVPERLHDPIDRFGIDQRLVALNADDRIEFSTE